MRNPRLAVYLPFLAALLLVAGSAVAIPPGPPTVVGGRNAAGWATTNAMTDGGHQIVDVGSGTLVATGADGGAVATTSSANVGVGYAEVCVSIASAYDGGAIFDAGFAGLGGTGVGRETYSVVVLPSGTRGFKLANSSTGTQVNWTVGARSAVVPVVGQSGNILESRGAGTGAYVAYETRNFTDVAAPEIHLSAASNMTSGVDGGTGCVRLEVAK
ncbi:MAG: hypothetical protein WC876_01905 [Candidatus Thermoplasmatota archaeon]